MNTILTTTQKALKLNLDTTIYGTFAEIGAGQDVVGNFFKAGASSGTVAKSISAYDMIISDTIYGKEKSGRYVCQSRLEKMLKYEYDLVLERLEGTRDGARFFSFANTISARNYHGTNEAHGWLGVRFRNKGNSHSDLILHVRMHDNTNQLQQSAIGILGVNMIYNSYNHDDNPEAFISSLMDNLSRNRIEIDMIFTSGDDFKCFDNRLLNLELVKTGLTDAILFNEKGEIALASDQFYKQNLLVARGSYRPPTKVNLDILKTGQESFSDDIKDKDVKSICEITISNLATTGDITKEDFLARVDLLASINYPVVITNFHQYFHLTNYLSRFKPKNLAIVLGAYNFQQIFDDDYNKINGGILEALGLLFMDNVKVYLYPYREEKETDELISLDNIPVDSDKRHLMNYIQSKAQIRDVKGFDNTLLHIYSRKVLNMITNDEKGWEELVPKKIAKTINDKCLFGHPCFFENK